MSADLAKEIERKLARLHPSNVRDDLPVTMKVTRSHAEWTAILAALSVNPGADVERVAMQMAVDDYDICPESAEEFWSNPSGNPWFMHESDEWDNGQLVRLGREGYRRHAAALHGRSEGSGEVRRLALEDAEALDRCADEADEANWQDWGALMRQAAIRIRALTGSGSTCTDSLQVGEES